MSQPEREPAEKAAHAATPETRMGLQELQAMCSRVQVHLSAATAELRRVDAPELCAELSCLHSLLVDALQVTDQVRRRRRETHRPFARLE